MKEFLSITSRENSVIKLVTALQTSSKARKENSKFIIEGLRICKDAFDNGIRFDKLIVSDSAVGKYADIIDSFSDSAGQCIKVPDSLFKKIGDTNAPQGIMAVAGIPDANSSLNSGCRYIALENLQDPSNLGAVSRTAEALGIDGIILSGNVCDPYSPKVMRASMGTLLRMPLFFTDNICEFACKYGLRTIACVVDSDAVSISEVDFKDGDILMIGNEANGLQDNTKAEADIKTTIPMSGRAESLNAAAAAAIAMWEMVRK